MESTHFKRDIFIVADDLGLTESINDGIIFLLKEGKISGASLMANGEAFDDAIKRIVADEELISTDKKELLYEDLTYKIRGAIFKVYNALGFGHKESAYQKALELELIKEGITIESQKNIALLYDGEKVGFYKPDIVVEEKIIIELKSSDFLTKNDKTQVLHYLRGSDYKLALLINFGSPKLQIERIINTPNQRESVSPISDNRSLNQRKSNFNIGIHLVLVEEKSLSGIKLSKNHKTFFVRYVLGLIKNDEVERELEAQIQKILEKGIKPQFINSHQHLHLLPGIMEITISLAKKYGIPYVRIVKEPLGSKGGLARKAQLVFLNFLSWMAKKKIARAGLGCNDYFVGFVNAGNISIDDMEYAECLTKKYPNKVIELGCHPGYENEELRNKYKRWGNYNWEKELNLLKDIILVGVVKTS